MATCSGSLVSKLGAVLLVAAGAAAGASAQTADAPEGGAGPLLRFAETSDGHVPSEDEAGEGEIDLSIDDVAPADAAPWRGSEIVYLNEVGVVGMNPSANLTWNPYWLMSWGFKPRWWFDETWYVGARLDVSREITQADDRTWSGETWVHDLLLSAGASKFVTIPWAEIDVSADIILTTPTSKISTARTMALGIGPGVRISRGFDLIGELSVGYHVRFSSFLHEYTTSELETPIVPSCTRSGSGCDEFLNTGVRNVQWRVQHGVDLSWDPLDWLGASLSFEHLVSWLYAIEGSDPRISSGEIENTDERYSSAFDAGVTFVPWAPIQIGLGYSTISPQLAPDSTYYNPFYNQYSTLYLEIRLEADALVSQFLGDEG